MEILKIEDKLVMVEGGDYVMGDQGKNFMKKDAPHKVHVEDFWIAKYEVTFEEYDEYCQANKLEKLSDHGWGRGKRPVVQLDPYEAMKYCNRLSILLGYKPFYTVKEENMDSEFDAKATLGFNPGGNGFRFPTEEEWEYAARGGKLSKGYLYAGSNDPDEVAWYGKNADHKTHPVGEKLPNELGIYDMSGNVFEFCSTREEPLVLTMRGGSWSSLTGSDRFLKVSSRYEGVLCGNFIGFRLCL